MMSDKLTLHEIVAERKVIRKEFRKVTERIAVLIEQLETMTKRNDELDEMQSAIEEAQCDT